MSQVGRAAAPAISVCISTANRREVLERCLASFARQTLNRDEFEVVVSDDESPDGTAAMVEGWENRLPVRLLRLPPGSLAVARNRTIDAARGRWLLLINDDTIAAPNLLAEHLRAHASADRLIAVLGRFDQPAAALDNALMRCIEHSDFGFPYRGMRHGQRFSWVKFWTCNVSISREAVAQAGGFDESFAGYGCEDSELGVRLQRIGVLVEYSARAAAEHLHTHDLAALRRRQIALARANVRLFRLHPELLDQDAFAWVLQLDVDRCHATSRAMSELLPGWESEAARLGRQSLAAASSADSLLARLHDLLAACNRGWWAAGTLMGLRDAGIDRLSPPEQTWSSPLALLDPPRTRVHAADRSAPAIP